MRNHINLFAAYPQNSETIENNLLRGFAVMLNENARFFCRFIDMINCNLSASIVNTFTSIAIRKSVSRIAAEYSEWIRRIIPVTITPAASDVTKREKVIYDPQNRPSGEMISDIIIPCGDELILIEVRKDNTDARLQVLSQAEAIRNSNSSIIVLEPMNISWKDIIKLLQHVKKLTARNDALLVNHYINFLREYHQDWFPAEPFKKSISAETVWKRIYSLAQNFARLLNGENATMDATSRGYAVDVDWEYVLQIHFRYESLKSNFAISPYPDNELHGNNLVINLYTGSTKIQSEALFSGYSKMDWTKKTKLDVFNEELYMSVTPTVNFTLMHGHLWTCSLSKKTVGVDRKRIREKLCSVINGKWEWNEYPALVDFLAGKNAENIVLVEDADFFKIEFAARIANSYRLIRTSLGYAIAIYIPLEKLEIIDRENPDFMKDENCDGVAKLAREAVLRLKNLIDGKDE